MQDFIQISKINDFLFCPFSIYLHGIYDNFSEQTYHSTYQTRGKLKHTSVDTKKYTTAKNILQGLEVYSERYGLVGKIDTLDTEQGKLVERKSKVAKIYDGYRYQLYAQYFCLTEMGFDVRSLTLYSMSDNRSHPLPLPGPEETREFEAVLDQIRNFNLRTDFQRNPQKCAQCIYNNLCE